ncbi:eukaryotic membrane protein family-domain-containing protein [Thamnocephalis sphaerospora]|uniref:Eukaryotic membrane protein family-domain-containing protein n=1 Tax=Thamnocephalis sphaerospora TaxID=78915 RepID=A0A4P9XIQ2_9FUNG|nr:eukaryotic membrane protein family-domain-containing protein [Thamnocephalis sphaerospora]|eukprot:RKP05578.1 eukaryotic membrane protein family-domain-containing protein [Thamnocephalis sphaerospora]
MKPPKQHLSGGKQRRRELDRPSRAAASDLSLSADGLSSAESPSYLSLQSFSASELENSSSRRRRRQKRQLRPHSPVTPPRPSFLARLSGSGQASAMTPLSTPSCPSTNRTDSGTPADSQRAARHDRSRSVDESSRTRNEGRGHRRRSSLRSIAGAHNNHLDASNFSTLWDFLKEELAADEKDTMAELKRERVSNFIHVPQEIEKLFLFGYVICLDTFLHAFTILPLRAMLALRSLISQATGGVRRLKSAQRVDLIKALLVVICCVGLQMVDASRLYHGVRGQSLLKLYVIYNMLEIFDKLFCSFGQDILDSFFSKIGSNTGGSTGGRVPHLHPLTHFVLAAVYLFIHTMVLFYQLVTLNVAINSYQNALLTLLISNQFVEIKSNVFKRFEKENLFQLTCADIVERFQLSVMLIIIAIRNLTELSGTGMSSSLPTFFFSLFPTGSIIFYNALTPVLVVFGCEMLVDWLKHAFITKFNHIRPSVYERYAEVLSRDLVVGPGTEPNQSNPGTRRRFIDHSPMVARRLGFASLPLGCLVIRNAIQIIRILSLWDAPETRSDTTALFQTMVFSQGDWITKCSVALTWAVMAVVVYICLVFLKLVVSVNLFRTASARYAAMQQREADADDQRHAATESKRFDADYHNQVKHDLRDRQDNVLSGQRSSITLETIDRFTLFKSRIP